MVHKIRYIIPFNKSIKDEKNKQMSKTKKIILILIPLLMFGAMVVLYINTSTDVFDRFFSRPIPTYTYKIVNSWPHDKSAFTEGLIFKDGILYESTGRNGSSDLRTVDLTTGSVKNKVDLDAQYFGEGITILNGSIFQLTWLNHKGFMYDQDTLSQHGEFKYEGEGWGLTDDGHSLIMSNGTNAITFLDPETFEVERVIHVFDNDEPLASLNELEYIKGEIYANIWHSDKIVRIHPESGKILGWIDLTGILPMEERQDQEAVLNGIAYDQETGRLFVTGKLWPWLFEIKLGEKKDDQP
jgi:glutamine cyclotransferase